MASASSPAASAPASPLTRHLLRPSSSRLQLQGGVELYRPAPILTISVARRGATAPTPKGRPAGEPQQGGGGKVHAATLVSRAVMVAGGEPTPPGSPAQGGGGKVHAAAPATASVVTARGPAPRRPGPPAEGGGGKVHAELAVAMARAVVGGPTPPGAPAEGAGGRGGIVNAAAA
ncbi:hypothetical protein BS78_07G060700 [Paspalum vaginatum]|nr:hypothetical protein BS78_07G060700 [Paspalum vaginatum]